MAGHSKWANIKHRKTAQDIKKGKLFTKLIREITVSARISPEVESNPRLRTAIDKALSHNMTRETIARAIKRGTGQGENTALEEVCYEAYGPNGGALLIFCFTDNRNRTASEVRHTLSKMGGNLSGEGSVTYLFSRVGELLFSEGHDEDKLIEMAATFGAEDVSRQEDGHFLVRTSPEAFSEVVRGFTEEGSSPESAQLTWVAAQTVTLRGEEATHWQKGIDLLEELEDVEEVFSNVVIVEDGT